MIDWNRVTMPILSSSRVIAIRFDGMIHVFEPNEPIGIAYTHWAPLNMPYGYIAETSTWGDSK